jgi:4-hydroxythreonine-4-phosphate dehydrogenase
MTHQLPKIALTLGDVAGIGPEVIVRAWTESPLRSLCCPIVIGHRGVLEATIERFNPQLRVQSISQPEAAERLDAVIPCLEATDQPLGEVRQATIDTRAGRAASDFLNKAIDLALERRIDAITTLPINKESLSASGVRHPGHTEILAERCGAREHAMMLYLPNASGEHGLGVVHATLHIALRDVFAVLTRERVAETIALADRALRPLTAGRPPRVAVAGLNPHAGEHGLFGDEESRIIEPAVADARREGIDVSGPIAADTLFARAVHGEFDAVVAMYHDQGHVAIKTIGFDRAVNVTLGLPIVRTSVAHGTAFDIVGQGRAETTSLISAVRVATRIVAGQRATNTP